MSDIYTTGCEFDMLEFYAKVLHSEGEKEILT